MVRALAPIVLLGILMMFYSIMVIAQPGGPSSITPESSERGNLSLTAATVEAQAGNVTELSINAITITRAWQGYYGNITGTVTLADSSNNIFYNWTGLGSLSGEVYASRDSAVDWSTINCTNSTELNGETVFLGKVAGDPDSVENTFDQVNHPSFQIGTTTLGPNVCNSTNAHIDTGQSLTDFYQILLADGGGDIVYTTLIDENQAGFNGVDYDFELLVGENGNSTSLASTTYYFYIELS